MLALPACLCDFTTIFLGTSIFVLLFWYMKSKQKKNSPPGPSGFPIVGYVPFATGNIAEKFFKLKETYGDIISVKIGSETWIILNDFDVINEAFVKNGHIFSGRPSNEVFDMVTGGKGIAMTDYGATWKNLRKFGISTLRGFGVGKRSMEESIIEETPYLIDQLTLSDDKRNLKMKLTCGVSNIICRVVFGSRFNYDDEEFVALLEILMEFTEESWETKLLGLVTLAPFLRHLPPFKNALKVGNDEVKKFLDILDKKKEEHKSSYDENDIRDFIDAFLREMKQNQNEEGFDDEYLLQYIRDLFEAGTMTTSSTLVWAMLAFLHYPDCQEKIYSEIKAAIGDSGYPSMKHRDQMPYTCAFIQEILRHRPIVPLGVFHKTTEDATLRGYTIPRNTTVWSNIWAVHFDSNTFDCPEEFRPERFLDDNGQFIKSKHVIPFSIGPRHCLGEQLARMELFIFLTGIVQKLRVLPEPNHPPPDFNSGVFNMMFYESHEFKVRCEMR